VGSVVALLTTGGTISTTADPVTGLSSPTLGGGDLRLLAESSEITLRVHELARVPSWTLDPPAMAGIATAARDAAHEPDVMGVVISHGTSTLEYTAFLADLVLDLPATVVLTGAMRRADDPEADGPANLRDAIQVAASPSARDLGAVVVFAGHIIAARHAWKARRVDPDAFLGLDGDVGRISAGRIEISRRPGRIAPFSGRLEPRVAFVKAVPGADGSMVEAALAGSPRGLVVEGLPGVGGMPPAMRGAVIGAATRIPVVLASRAPFGRLPESPTGGTGEPLRDAGLLSAGDLSAEQSWLLLMAALADGENDADVRERFLAVAMRNAGNTEPQTRQDTEEP
jgi:L-asparaginase